MNFKLLTIDFDFRQVKLNFIFLKHTRQLKIPSGIARDGIFFYFIGTPFFEDLFFSKKQYLPALVENILIHRHVVPILPRFALHRHHLPFGL